MRREPGGLADVQAGRPSLMLHERSENQKIGSPRDGGGGTSRRSAVFDFLENGDQAGACRIGHLLGGE